MEAILNDPAYEPLAKDPTKNVERRLLLLLKKPGLSDSVQKHCETSLLQIPPPPPDYMGSLKSIRQAYLWDPLSALLEYLHMHCKGTSEWRVPLTATRTASASRGGRLDTAASTPHIMSLTGTDLGATAKFKPFNTAMVSAGKTFELRLITVFPSRSCCVCPFCRFNCSNLPFCTCVVFHISLATLATRTRSTMFQSSADITFASSKWSLKPMLLTRARS